MQQGNLPLVVTGSRPRGVPKDHDTRDNESGGSRSRRGRVIGDGEIGLAIVGLLDDHLRPIGLRQGDDQILDGHPILLSRFGDVALAPLGESEISQFPLGHQRRRRRLDYLNAKRELPQLVLKSQRQMVGGGVAAAGQFCNVLDAHGAAAVGGDGEYARLEVVSLGPLHQPGVDPAADDLLEDPPRLVLLYCYAIDHNAADVQGVSADGGTLRQGEIEVALHHPGHRVGEGHGGRGFGHRAEDAHLDPQVGQAQRHRNAPFPDHQGRRDGLCRQG